MEAKMSVGRALGTPDYTSGGDNKFIPEIWSGKLLEKFYKATVYAEISNTEYEGEIKNVGDKVVIRTTPDITINTYVKGQKLVYERPESDSTELTIDYAKYFAFECDDIDAYQTDIALMDKWSDDAAQQLKISIESGIFTAIYDSASAYNKGITAGKESAGFNLGTSAAPVQITKANVIDYLVDCGTVLDETNRPDTDRWIVIPSWMAGMLKKSDLKDASMTGDGKSVLRNGKIGQLDRWTIYSSNNLYRVTDTVYCWYVMFGHISALTWAAQISKTEQLRAESTFADLIRGLTVYGFDVLQPESLGALYVRK
jgi:hypothetical protein